ncbi:hypothetical protein GN956_G22216 [Arapaima gigas]
MTNTAAPATPPSPPNQARPAKDGVSAQRYVKIFGCAVRHRLHNSALFVLHSGSCRNRTSGLTFPHNAWVEMFPGQKVPHSPGVCLKC